MSRIAIAGLFAAALGVTACSTYYDDPRSYDDGARYGGYRYDGRDYDRPGNDCGFFGGSGGRMLDPWLACTAEGQELVHRGFDRDGNRRIDTDQAERANIWFRRHADTDGDLCLTDPEIRTALANAALHHRRYGG